MTDRVLITNICKICGCAFYIREIDMNTANALANVTSYQHNPPIEEVCCPNCMTNARNYLKNGSSQK